MLKQKKCLFRNHSDKNIYCISSITSLTLINSCPRIGRLPTLVLNYTRKMVPITGRASASFSSMLKLKRIGNE